MKTTLQKHLLNLYYLYYFFSLVNDVDRNSNFKGRIIYTPMHGVGSSYIDRAFQVPMFHIFFSLSLMLRINKLD